MTGSLVFALAMAEIVVRVFFPIYGGRDNVTLDGRTIQTFLEPSSVYRQVSNEYDALTTITDRGYRAPAVVGNPDVVVVGDSFAFGFGLTDDETFANLYCKERHRSCVNLGMPGSGTNRQVRRLEQFLTKWDWHPKQVKLFFFGMSNSFSSGNDFVDNFNFGRWLEEQKAKGILNPSIDERGRPTQAPSPQAQQARQERPRISFGEYVISWQTEIVDNVHLMRRAKYHWGPFLRSLVLAEPGEQRTAEALVQTTFAFKELDELSKRFGFEYEVFLIVPSHDILMGTQDATLALLNRATIKPAIPTAQLFKEGPSAYYFSYDGHLNARGARKVADFLVSRENERHASQVSQ